MDVSKIVELVNALEDTWIGYVVIYFLFYKFFSCIFKWKLFSSITRYFELTRLYDFGEFLKAEQESSWHNRFFKWFISKFRH